MESKSESIQTIVFKKYSAIGMFKCAPEFRESSGVKVDSLLPQDFFDKCSKLFPTAENEDEKDLKRKLNEIMYDKAQKKHKNYLRRQRAKQAKSAQKDRDSELQKEEAIEESKEDVVFSGMANKFDTLSMAGSDSGVSVKSANSNKTQKIQKTKKNNQKTVKNIPKIKTVQKFTVFKSQTSPDSTCTPEFSVRQPVFATGLRSNFRNQGKLRASNDDTNVIGSGSSSVFAAKPVTEARTWSNSRLHKRQPRGRIGSRS
jgi:hypothetical protein